MRKLESRHIDGLLSKLDQHRNAFFDPPPDQRPQRLWFVDSDVISTYINGTLRDRENGWASLFSIDAGGHSHDAGGERATEADELTDAIAQAVGRFIFGQFNQQLQAQQGRYYLTPEHERELKAIVLAVLHEAASPSAEWQNRLQAEYLRLCNNEVSAAEALSAAEIIVSALDDQSAVGRVPRAYAIHRDYTVVLSTNIVRASRADSRSFVFSADDPGYTGRFSRFKDLFFDIFLTDLKERHRGIDPYLEIKRIVHSMHTPDLPLRRYVEHVKRHGGGSLDLSPKQREEQAVIAVLDCNDVASLARMAALAGYLSADHKLSDQRGWEVCLISGSPMLHSLRDALGRSLHSTEVGPVRIVHPLCFLRDPLLYDPKGVKCFPDFASGESPNQEYALSRIFGAETPPMPAAENRDPTEFVRSLTRTLYGVIAREAEENDRSLGAFWRVVKLDERFNRGALQDSVRHFIAYRFTDTFVKLTELSPAPSPRLSPVSMPALDLQHSPAALLLVEGIRLSVATPEPPTSVWQRIWGRSAPKFEVQQQFGGEKFERTLEEDSTGYSAMLCAAIGYISRGAGWVNAAQTMTSTAVMLAAGRQHISDYPQGNEALYLRTFLSRVTFDPREKRPGGATTEPRMLVDTIAIWLRHQMGTLSGAFEAAGQWSKWNREAAEDTTPIGQTRYELIVFRYEVEKTASEVFGLLWSILLLDDEERSNAKVDMNQATVLFARICDLLAQWMRCRDKGQVNGIGIQSPALMAHYYKMAAFIESQLWAASLQCWLCVRFRPAGRQVQQRVGLDSALEERIASSEAILSKHFASYRGKESDDSGHVVKLTAETFAVAKMNARKGECNMDARLFDKVHFCAIDELRFPFFKGCWDLVCTPRRGGKAAGRLRAPRSLSDL